MNKYTLRQLLDRFLTGRATASEQKLLEDAFDRLGTNEQVPQPAARDQERMKVNILEQTRQRIQELEYKRSGMAPRRHRTKWLAAAAVFCCLIAGSLMYFLNDLHPGSGQPAVSLTGNPEKGEPGREGAILTLADGSVIVLDSAGNGPLTTTFGASIMKTNEGLTYNNGDGHQQIAYNTLATPNGRQYMISLADGTKVWLNAASSITFPTAFASAERKVAVSGEVYFEVAEDPEKRFVVSMPNGEEVQVYGTHFNINAYENEPVTQTTLLEGSVKFIKDNRPVWLEPGQQVVSARHGSDVHVVHADMDKAIAWKEGFFQFDDADLRYLLRQMARWYNMEIGFEGTPGGRKLGGRIDRNLSLPAVLKIFDAKDIHYRMDGEKIIVKL